MKKNKRNRNDRNENKVDPLDELDLAMTCRENIATIAELLRDTGTHHLLKANLVAGVGQMLYSETEKLEISLDKLGSLCPRK